MMTWKEADASRLDLDRIAFLALALAEDVVSAELRQDIEDILDEDKRLLRRLARI